MRKLLINNFFVLTIAALACTAIHTIVWVNDLMESSDLLITGLLGIMATGLFEKGTELIDSRFKKLCTANKLMYVTALAGMVATYGSGYGMGLFVTIASWVLVAISKAARVFIYIYSAKLMMEFVSSDEQKGNKKGWTVQLVISIVCWTMNLIISVGSNFVYFRTEEFARGVEEALGLATIGVYMAMLIHLIFLLKETAATVNEKVEKEEPHILWRKKEDPHLKYKSDDYKNEDDSDKNNEDTTEISVYGYTKRVVIVTVVIALVFILQTVVRYELISAAVSSTEKMLSQEQTTAADPDGSIFGKIGYMPADDWTTVTSLEEIKEIRDSDLDNEFVILVDKSNIEALTINEYKAVQDYYTANIIAFMYGKSPLYTKKIWGITDYKITFEDGSTVFATYATNMIDKLEDGVVKLPIAYTYKTEDVKKVLEFELENRHVTPIEQRNSWMEETPVCGSLFDKLEFGNILTRNAGIYMLVMAILALAAVIVTGRLGSRAITE
ncbi:MAG: hypothetical protein MJ104_03105 [Lachnospiraceae bacterium]|nr:hypothetical protein [Lachnospiraceae bacterium]